MKYSDQFRIVPGSKVKLNDIDPGFKGRHDRHKDAAGEIEQDQQKLLQLQELLYTDRHRSELFPSAKWAIVLGGCRGQLREVHLAVLVPWLA
jgi:hypothetical protein